MTIIEQQRKERLEEILRQIDFLLEQDTTLRDSVVDHLGVAKNNLEDALTILDNSEASNGQS